MSDENPQKRSWRERLGNVTPERRKLIVRVAVVVVLVTALAIVPAYVATRPQFMQRYGGMSKQYTAWTESVHAQVACQSCHVPPGRVAQGVYTTRMLGEFYLSLVMPSRQPALFKTPTNAACQSCHIDLRTVSPSGDLNIPHRAHVSVLKLNCVQCHDYLVHEKNPEGTHTPRMETCLKCHDGVKAKNACSACHTNKSVPESHKAADWLVVHASKQKQIDCAECHKWTENWCAECHQRRPASHGKRWRTVHRAAVDKRRNCEVCHEGAFCVRCHGEVPKSNFDPALTIVQ
ncbi:MAG: hypothetical protein HGB10_05965 [Coriobacteriia bacterium]|nr:hypothetical protein [Coriobacteriia bacterium]